LAENAFASAIFAPLPPPAALPLPVGDVPPPLELQPATTTIDAAAPITALVQPRFDVARRLAIRSFMLNPLYRCECSNGRRNFPLAASAATHVFRCLRRLIVARNK
jgi:hypothetical protein